MSNKPSKEKKMGSTFYAELEELINQYSIESDSNTPDYILAKYVMDCLGAFNNAMIHRDGWYNLNQSDRPKEQL